MSKRVKNEEDEETRGFYNDMEGIPLQWRLAGDRLFPVEQTRYPVRVQQWRPDYPARRLPLYGPHDSPRSLQEIEGEERLYSRLAKAAYRGRDKDVRLYADWRRHALGFANLYAPPVACLSDPYYFERGVLVSHFGQEALLAWWVLELRRRIEEGDEGDDTLIAAVQVRWLEPALGGFYDGWHLGYSGPSRVAPPRYPGSRAATLADIDRFHGGGYSPPLPTEVRCLTPARAKQEADKVRAYQREREQGEEDSTKTHEPQLFGWTTKRLPTYIGACVLSSLMNVKLAGVCPGYRPPLVPSFTFLTPRARIWFGLWEDLGTLNPRLCPQCGKLFIPTRKDQRCCTGRCRSLYNTRRSREARNLRPPPRPRPRHLRRRRLAGPPTGEGHGPPLTDAPSSSVGWRRERHSPFGAAASPFCQ